MNIKPDMNIIGTRYWGGRISSMWKEILLQVLIAFLPVCSFMVWFNRPEQSRYAYAFIGIVSVISLLLCMHFSVSGPYGIHLDFRSAPLLIGSLYGGAPTAVILAALYSIVRLWSIEQVWQYVVFACFSLVFFSSVFYKIF